MKLIIANIIGITAVILFVLSYQIKTRKNIIICNTVSRVLYALQYILLGAFSGAVLDISSVFASMLAEKKDTKFIKKHLKLIIILVNAVYLIIGIFLYKSPVDLLPLFGVIFHTGAFWLTNEKHIRLVSFFGSPFWLCYNLINAAYGSAVGDIMTICSISLAIVRYDILKKEQQKNEP